LTISALTIDGIDLTKGIVPAHQTQLLTMGLVLLAIPLAGLHLGFANQRLSADALRRSPIGWTVLMATLAAAVWSSYRCQSEFAPTNTDFPELMSRSLNMELETQFVGISDRGRQIALFRSASAPIAPEQAFHLERPPNDPQYGRTVIARGAPDTASNCHGWVFAGGEFLLDAKGIKIILKDNGYVPCSMPQPGDVVVYFERGDSPVHSGMVSAVLHDGTVIVESKWGIDGRYLHRPEDQPYSTTFTYYRSQRGGNQITIGEVNSALARQRLPVPRRIRKA
jgi:hypothetical protein